MSKQKYYAVKVGMKPGVYLTWEECKRQTKGFPNATYKLFLNENEAYEYINNNLDDKSSIDKQINQYIKKGKTVIFTDGSYKEDINDASWAFLILRKDNKPLTASGLVTNKKYLDSRNVAGEVYAVIKALQYSNQKGFNDIVIFHDYQGLARWYDGSWKTNKEISIEYVKALNKYNNLKIDFVWVKGHSNVYYNEIVDKLAFEVLDKKRL